MNTETRSDIRYYLKQIFCKHRHQTTAVWYVFEQGVRILFRTKVCNECGRQFRLDS
jgi:hypothetical protein